MSKIPLCHRTVNCSPINGAKTSMNGSKNSVKCEKKFLRRRALIHLLLLIFAYKSFIMNYPDNLRYTKDPEWIRLEGNIAPIGITDFAQRELGDRGFVVV